MIEKKSGRMTKRTLTKDTSMKIRPLLLNPERKYRYLWENGAAAMLMLGADGKVIDVNNALLEMSGYSRDELVGKNSLDFVLPEQKEKAAAQIQAALTHGAASQFEVMFRSKDGSSRALLLPSRQLVLEEEGQRSILVMGVDITERLRVEQALQRQADLLQKTFNSAMAAIFVLDAEDPPVIIECNPAASEIFGYEKSEMVGRPTSFLHVSDESLRKFQAQFYPAIEKDEYFNLEYQMKRKDGSVFASEHAVTPLLDNRGKRTGWVSVISDITERDKYETRLLALHTHASQLSSAEEIDTIVRCTLDAMEFTLGLKHSYFLLVENASLQIRGSRGRHVAYSAMPLDGRGMTVKAANTKTTLRISDTRKEPGFVDPKGYDWTGPPTALSELVVPVLIDAEAVAVLCVDSPRLGNFTDDDQRLLETLAIHVGSALERLRHEEELETIAKFPSENPSPVFRLNGDGTILFANQASNALLQIWGCKVGGICPKFWQDLVKELLTHQTSKTVDIDVGKRAYAIYLVPVVSAGYVNAYGRDITERTHMEKALQESEEKYRAIVENSPNLIGILQDGILKYVNNVAVLNLGWTDEELLSTSFDPIENAVSEKSRSVLKENIAKRLRGEPMAPYEVTLTRKDGSEVPVLVRAAKIIYNQRPAIEFVFDDITERKRDEEKLRESEERYHSLFDRMLDGIYLSTHAGRFVDINPAFVKMFRYSNKQEMLDITDIKKDLYFSPEERGSHILDTGQEEVEAYQMRRKDGSEVWVEDRGRYIHDEQGNIIYHEGILRDITERKRLEEKLRQHSLHLEELVGKRTRELRESEEKYRELFEACPVSLWEEDFSAVNQFVAELRQKGISDFDAYFANHPKDVAKCAALVKVLNVNEATLSLYNAKSVDEIIGLSDVLTEKSNRAFVGQLVALAQGKKYHEAEFENRTLRGETKHCNVICAVVPGYEQSLAKVLICIVDLTAQKNLEAELVKSQRLAAIGETAAMVGHDLRNPLQGIAGAVHLLKKESLTAKERDEMLELIQDNVAYGDTIVRDLSDYSATEMQLNLAEAAPKSIMRDAIGAVKVPQNVTIQNLSEDQPTLRVDPDRMRRVFVNLIENAIDAMPQGGTLTISSKVNGGSVEIALTDTGSGMPEKVVENLWKPLQTTKAKGLGLGLAICKRIMDAHGGTISVKSKAGEGTTMTIGLPIKPVTVEVKQK
ncbi:MAG: PAS domain S-box protein [Candidatus Bathyarchaeia archaeon]